MWKMCKEKLNRWSSAGDGAGVWTFFAFSLLLFLSCIARLLIYAYGYQVAIPGFSDHKWIWTECRVALLGTSPYQALREGTSVGGLSLYSHVSSLPWGLTLGTFLHGAFLPYEASVVWFFVWNVMIFVCMLFCVRRKLSKEGYGIITQISALLLLCSSWYYYDGLSVFNNGMLICFLCVIAACEVNECEWVAGLCMLFGMIKPQDVLPFLLTFLILKKWKPIVIAAIGTVLAWAVSAIWTGESPTAQLYGVISFASNPEESFHYEGILDPLRLLGVPSAVTLLASMLFGCAVLAWVVWFLRKNKCDSAWVLYGACSIVAVFWCYKSPCDYLVLGLPAVAFLLSKNRKLSAVWIAILLVKPFSTWLLGSLPFFEGDYLRTRLDLCVKALMLIPLVWTSVRTQSGCDK